MWCFDGERKKLSCQCLDTCQLLDVSLQAFQFVSLLAYLNFLLQEHAYFISNLPRKCAQEAHWLILQLKTFEFFLS